jgi:general secretion pathway protein E
MVDVSFMKGEGCQECRSTGYAGRDGIYELLCIDEGIRNLIASKASSSAIRSHATSNGFVTLREEGIKKVLKGQTTVEEVLRVTQEVEE